MLIEQVVLHIHAVRLSFGLSTAAGVRKSEVVQLKEIKQNEVIQYSDVVFKMCIPEDKPPIGLCELDDLLHNEYELLY